jgi:transcriptional regulator with XRE-family HTH domain
MVLGENMMLIRKKKAFSQAELGRMIDTSGDLIGRYEHGDISRLLRSYLKLLMHSKYLSITSSVKQKWNWINRHLIAWKIYPNCRIRIENLSSHSIWHSGILSQKSA